MSLARYLSVRRNDEADPHQPEASKTKRYLPLLANPINDDVREVLSSSSSNLEKMRTTTSTDRRSDASTSVFAGGGRTSRGNLIIYKQHHEASTIELFYDLFFVANLGMNISQNGSTNKSLTAVQPTSQPCISIRMLNVRIIQETQRLLLISKSTHQLPKALHSYVVYVA